MNASEGKRAGRIDDPCTAQLGREARRFVGLLCPLGIPSDTPPNGSRGHRVSLSEDVARELYGTLIGTPAMIDHYTAPVGEVTCAWIANGGLYVAGVAEHGEYSGLSLHLTDVKVSDMSGEVWEITDGRFIAVAMIPSNKRPAWVATWIRWTHDSGLFVIDGGRKKLRL